MKACGGSRGQRRDKAKTGVLVARVAFEYILE